MRNSVVVLDALIDDMNPRRSDEKCGVIICGELQKAGPFVSKSANLATEASRRV